MESESPPRSAICCFCYSTRSDDRKKKSSRGVSGLDEKGNGNWEKTDEILSDMSTFSVKEQERRLKKAKEEEERLSREAEKAVRWVKQESARMDVSAIKNLTSEDDDPINLISIVIDLKFFLFLLLIPICSFMESRPSPPRLKCCLWQTSKRNDSTEKSKCNGISGTNAYYGDWGMDDTILTDKSTFSVKEQERMLKKAMKEQENAIKKGEKVVKFVRKKSEKFGN
ncbi:hypothetical protein F0562_035573 [Nyssa sinensis]|uniref:Uncharacterized protein n=1 Tax=Nyssa sinensis TaxID=561372 RepID=A0A5J5AEN8_9ASTE|nr:hypothetical protein F0562_035573 [Nyssa sinensis]